MQIKVECVGKEGEPAHTFDLEVPVKFTMVHQIRGFERVSGVVCPVCGTEQDVSAAAVSMVMSGASKRVKRKDARKLEKARKYLNDNGREP